MTIEEQKKKGLGRGLSALLGDTSPSYEVLEVMPGGSLHTLPLSCVHPSTLQPRKRFSEQELRQLEQSIREKGILQPLLVRPHQQREGEYELIAGERRWRSAQKAGLTQAPVLIIEASDKEVLEAALIENIQRSDLTPIEEAEGYHRLMGEFSYTQEQLSDSLGKSRSHIANTLRLLQLPESIKVMVQEGYLTAGHARCLVNVPDAAALAEHIIKKELSVRETERLIRSLGTTPSKKGTEEDPSLISLAKHLEHLLGLPVQIKNQGLGGKIMVQYHSPQDVDQLLQRSHALAAA